MDRMSSSIALDVVCMSVKLTVGHLANDDIRQRTSICVRGFRQLVEEAFNLRKVC